MPLITTVFAVQTTQGQIWPPASGPPGGAKRVSIYNTGPNPIHIGPTGVSINNGYKIPAGSFFTFSQGIVNTPIFGVAEGANQVSPADTRIVVEVAD